MCSFHTHLEEIDSLVYKTYHVSNVQTIMIQLQQVPFWTDGWMDRNVTWPVTFKVNCLLMPALVVSQGFCIKRQKIEGLLLQTIVCSQV